MSSQIKAINEFFRMAGKGEISCINDRIVLTDRQTRIFEMKYIRGLDIGFISDALGCCPRVVQKELRIIRTKVAKAIGLV